MLPISKMPKKSTALDAYKREYGAVAGKRKAVPLVITKNAGHFKAEHHARKRQAR